MVFIPQFALDVILWPGFVNRDPKKTGPQKNRPPKKQAPKKTGPLRGRDLFKV